MGAFESLSIAWCDRIIDLLLGKYTDMIIHQVIDEYENVMDYNGVTDEEIIKCADKFNSKFKK